MPGTIENFKNIHHSSATNGGGKFSSNVNITQGFQNKTNASIEN